MAENYTKTCRICLKNDREVNISDSSCYAKFFIQVLSLKDSNEKLFLCIWCKATLRRAMAVFTLALESENTPHNKVSSDISIEPKSLYAMNYVHNSHIDIPPHLIEYADLKTKNITIEMEELTNPLAELQDDEITSKINNKKILKSAETTNEESISNEQELIENETATKKRNKIQFEFNELKFEVENLNLEEQLIEVELKKLKYKEFNFQCVQCGVGLLTYDVFEAHKLRHSELSGQHICPICSLRFKSQDVLSQHTLAHRRRFKCLICSSIFTRQYRCVAHRYKCGGLVQHIACGECSKIFSNEYSLKIHMKVHKTDNKYCCDQCDKKFGSKQKLTVHLRSHSGIKPFSCPKCACSFATQSNLRAHSAVHDDTKQFYCVECDKYYKTAKNLKTHFNVSTKHVGQKSDKYSCKECSKQFCTERSLNSHVSTRHGTEHRCTQCDKTFCSKSNLNKHIKCIHTAK